MAICDASEVTPPGVEGETIVGAHAAFRQHPLNIKGGKRHSERLLNCRPV